MSDLAAEVGRLAGTVEALQGEVATSREERRADMRALHDKIDAGFVRVTSAIDTHAQDDHRQFSVLNVRLAKHEGARAGRQHFVGLIVSVTSAVSAAIGALVAAVALWFAGRGHS